MATLVAGIGTSHSPMLSMDSGAWAARAGANDQRNQGLVGVDGLVSNYEDLLARTDVTRIAKEITPDKMQARHERNQAGIAWVAEQLYAQKLDLLVMIGDDQQEYLRDDNMPSFCVYWGDEVRVKGQGKEYTGSTGNQPLIGYAIEDRDVPTHAGLGRHIIEHLVEAEFDVGSSNHLDYDKGGRSRGGVGHAFGFVYHRVLTDGLIPTVPIMVNTYYPPSPSAARCYRFGQTMRQAIEAWDSDKKVAIVASGGLSHTVIEEELDSKIIDGLRHDDVAKLTDFEDVRFRGGTSEIKNWIGLAGALSGTGLNMNMVDYVPCYRTEAGNGCAMGFAEWT